MSLLIALIFLVVGIICVNRPARIVQWISDAMRRAGHGEIKGPGWLQARSVIILIRLVGILALLNAVTLIYIASQPTPIE